MSYWLKMIGASDFHCPQHPFTRIPSLKEQVRFPKNQFPKNVIYPGDMLVYYAVGGWKRIFAVVEVTGQPERDVPSGDPMVDKRWPHAAPVTVVYPALVDDLEHAPDLGGVSPMLQHEIHQGVSHIPMGRPQFDRAMQAIARAGVTSRSSSSTRSVVMR